MNSTWKLGLSIMTLLGFSNDGRSNELDENLKRRFMDEYPVAARALESRMAISKVVVRSVGGTGPQRVITILRDHECERAEVRISSASKKAAETELIYVRCPDRYFELGKNPGQSTYSVLGIGKSPMEAIKYENTTGRLASPQLGSSRSLLSNTAKYKDAEIVACSALPDNPELVRVRFAIKYNAMLEMLTFVLDPEKSWAIVSEERSSGSDEMPVSKMVVEYVATSDGFAMPSKVRFANRRGEWDEYRYDRWTFEPANATEFTMKRFGLPEIAGNPAANLRLRNRIAIGVIAVFVVTGIVIVKLSGRNLRIADS